MIPAPPVPAALRRFVVGRFGYDVDFGAPGVHRGLPSTTLTLVLPLDEPLRVSWVAVGLDQGRRRDRRGPSGC